VSNLWFVVTTILNRVFFCVLFYSPSSLLPPYFFVVISAVIKRTRGAQYDDEQLPQTREVFKDTLELNTLLDKEDINRVNEEEPLEGSSHIDE